MDMIYEISDDSNGCDRDPNKKPQQLQKKPKKVQKKISSYIPEDLTEECLALVGRCHYPTLSLISKSFNRIITSPSKEVSLYDLRSSRGRAEPVLYACVGTTLLESPRWYILYRKPYRNRNVANTFSLALRKIEPLPHMPWGAAVVTIGYEMYVMGGCVGEKRTKKVMLIDCRFHTCSLLPSMRVARYRAATGVIDGKIYVLGGCEMRARNWVETFDLKDKVWDRYEWSPQPENVSSEFVTSVVMGKRVYVLGETIRYAYEPRGEEGGAWKSLLPAEFGMSDLWQASSCVIDGMLFSVNSHRLFGGFGVWCGYPIIIYDPKEDMWMPLAGLEGFPANIQLCESKMANVGGKLVVLGTGKTLVTWPQEKKEIWCVEIALEKRQGGEIYGEVESAAVVCTFSNPPVSIELCRTVTV